jgi:hypothetical protein
MIFLGLLVVIANLDKFDFSVAFLIALIALWIWDYNDIQRRAKKNKYSYYNRRRRKNKWTAF